MSNREDIARIVFGKTCFEFTPEQSIQADAIELLLEREFLRGKVAGVEQLKAAFDA